MIKELLEKFLGECIESHESQLKFNCPKCAEENDNIPDNKHNLEINLANDNEKYGTDKIFNCWKCGYKSGSLKRIFFDYAPKELLDYYHNNSLDKLLYDAPPNKKFWKIYLPDEFISINNLDLNNPYHNKAYDYLINERKISHKTLEFFNVGVCFEGYYKNRIIIPSYDENNELNAFIGRSFVGEKPSYLGPSVDKDNIIYNENNINWNLPIFMVEGWFDLFALPVNTIPLNGKKMLSKLFNKIKEHRPPLVLIFDPDAFNDMETTLNDLMFLNLPLLKKIELNKYDLAKNFEFNGKKYIFEITKDIFN